MPNGPTKKPTQVNWLLLRGLAKEKRHWGTFPSVLENKDNNTKTYLLDLPGIGEERARPCPANIDEIINDLRSRWLSLSDKNPGTWQILGISLGGMITLRWLERYPLDFENGVIINSSAANLSLPTQRLKPRALILALESLFQTSPLAREQLILNITTRLKSKAEIETIANAWTQFAQETPLPKNTVLFQIAAAIRFKAPKKISNPLIFIRSMKDQFTSPQCSQALANHYQAVLKTHPSAGHDLPLDDPEWLTETIRVWLGFC